MSRPCAPTASSVLSPRRSLHRRRGSPRWRAAARRARRLAAVPGSRDARRRVRRTDGALRGDRRNDDIENVDGEVVGVVRAGRGRRRDDRRRGAARGADVRRRRRGRDALDRTRLRPRCATRDRRGPDGRSRCSPRGSGRPARYFRDAVPLTRGHLGRRGGRLRLARAGDEPRDRRGRSCRRSSSREVVQALVAADETTAYIGDVDGTVTAIDLDPRGALTADVRSGPGRGGRGCRRRVRRDGGEQRNAGGGRHARSVERRGTMADR